MVTVDLFSGCGGMSLGFQKAGFEVVAAYENWQAALETYRANFNHDIHDFDLSDGDQCIKDILARYSPEVLIGGPPCQDFSIANSRKTTERANLTVEFSRIVAGVLPKMFVMENVYNIEKSPFLKQARANLKRAGYGLTERVIDACRVGVPQMRKRYFLIGLLGGEDDYFGPSLDAGLSTSRMTVRQYFGPEFPLDFYYAHPRSYQRRAIFSVDEPSATIRRVNRPIPPNYTLHPADKAPVTSNLRPLTTEERSRVQTFPANFKFVGTVSQREQQIGNAVPVALAQYVAQTVLNALEGATLARKDKITVKKQSSAHAE